MGGTEKLPGEGRALEYQPLNPNSHLIQYYKLLISQSASLWKPSQASPQHLPACLLAPLTTADPRFTPLRCLCRLGSSSQLAGVAQSRCCPVSKYLQGTQERRSPEPSQVGGAGLSMNQGATEGAGQGAGSCIWAKVEARAGWPRWRTKAALAALVT